MITQLLVWMVMAYGLSNILVYGSIFNKPRNFIFKEADYGTGPLTGLFKFLKGMLSCMMCTPVWVGFFSGLFLYSPVHEILNVTTYVSWFFDGMLASGAVWAIKSIIEWFEQNRPNNNHN
jgi:hypothetical protein